MTPPLVGALPPPPAAVHFVGIGGIGMSGLARILHAWGYRVSGSDAAASDQTASLAAAGIAVAVGHGGEATGWAAAADLIVVTAAVRGENPELAAARAAGVAVVKRAALLGLLANARRCLAVAGSHGKSTTSGMLVAALRALGADPSYAIGAVVGVTGTNAAAGAGAEMVVEADEYDHSFLHLTPDLAIVTNVDYDHPDIFPDGETYDGAFAHFIGGIRPGGTLVIPGDDEGVNRLTRRPDWAPPPSVVRFGETGEVEWRLRGGEGAWRVAGRDGREWALPLTVPGRHNARNATAALALLVAAGWEPGAVARALGEFTGVGRRFELKGEVAGVTLVDDYAHHPSELRATLRAARGRYPGRRLWAVFQPHTYSRLKALLPAFGSAFTEADQTMILDVYAARETDNLGVGAADLRALIPNALAATGPADAAARLALVVAPGDLVLTLGAGSVTEVGPLLLREIGQRSFPSPADSRPMGAASSAPTEGGRPSSVPQGAKSENVPSGDGERRAGRAARSRNKVEGFDAAVSIIPDHPHLKLLRDSPMSLHTTWRVGGPADWLVRAPSPADLLAAIAWGRQQGMPVTVIGGGSNLLVGDGGVRGLVVLARTPGERATGLVVAEDLGDVVRLRVGASVPLSWIGRYAAERGWSGLDWGVGLPGTVGGATVNNAGAHGTEQRDHLETVVLYDNILDKTREEPVAWLEAAYRHTIIKASPRPRRFTVVEIVVRLPKGDRAELVQRADEHAQFRKRTQPTGACGGSTFSNPPDDHAGRLLEEAGMKGYAVGGATFSPKHANWIVNTGGAHAAEIGELIATARERVRDRIGVELRAEIEELGERE